MKRNGKKYLKLINSRWLVACRQPSRLVIFNNDNNTSFVMARTCQLTSTCLSVKRFSKGIIALLA